MAFLKEGKVRSPYSFGFCRVHPQGARAETIMKTSCSASAVFSKCGPVLGSLSRGPATAVASSRRPNSSSVLFNILFRLLPATGFSSRASLLIADSRIICILKMDQITLPVHLTSRRLRGPTDSPYNGSVCASSSLPRLSLTPVPAPALQGLTVSGDLSKHCARSCSSFCLEYTEPPFLPNSL